jgi:hypothetical protein
MAILLPKMSKFDKGFNKLLFLQVQHVAKWAALIARALLDSI